MLMFEHVSVGAISLENNKLVRCMCWLFGFKHVFWCFPDVFSHSFERLSTSSASRRKFVSRSIERVFAYLNVITAILFSNASMFSIVCLCLCGV